MRVVALMVVVSAWLASGVGLAQAQNIYPISDPGGTAPFTPDTASPVFITLSPTPASSWLPSPSPSANVTINLNNATAAAMTLVCPDSLQVALGVSCASLPDPYNPIAAGQLRTSAYPGICTNVPEPTSSYQADFTLGGSLSAPVLTSNDCGGMAVVNVTTTDGTNYTFILPQDSDYDGIPDIWEAKFGLAFGQGSVVATADNDSDGITNYDEYRGVVLNSIHTRTHHNERDVFVGLINPGCGGSPSLLSGTGAYLPVASSALSLFDNLKNALPATGLDPAGPRVHLVGFGSGGATDHGPTGEWTDSFANCTFNPATGDLDITYTGAADLDRLVTNSAVYAGSERPGTSLTVSGNNTLTAGAKVFNQSHVGASVTVVVGGSGSATITAINENQTQATANIITPFSPASVAAGNWRIGTADQKGLRCIESLDTSSTTIFALSGWTTPDDTLHCTIYSKRIEFRMKNTNTALGPLGLIPKGGSRKLRIQTTSNGGRSWDNVFVEGTDRAAAERQVVAEVMRFYVTMEILHGLKQKATLGTCTNHDCAGAGYVLDKDFVQVIDKSTSGFNTFRISTKSNPTITDGAKLRDP